MAAIGRLGAPILIQQSAIPVNKVRRAYAHSLNKMPNKNGFISICNLSPNCLLRRSSCVQPRNAHGLLKSYQNSSLTSSPLGMPLLTQRGSRLRSGVEIELNFRPSLLPSKTASRNCIRSWPQYSLPVRCFPSRSIHVSSGTQKPGTPGVPLCTA